MKIIQLIKVVLCYIVLITTSVARGQVSPSDGRLTLYKLDRVQGKYVLCMNFDSSEKGKTSHVVIGDTFAVQPHGAVCYVVMSNAYILQTIFGRAPSNEVAQSKMWVDIYRIPFPERTKLVFNNSVVELPKVKIETTVETNMNIYEGDEALRQAKKIGFDLPEDIDMEKARGHKGVTH